MWRYKFPVKIYDLNGVKCEEKQEIGVLFIRHSAAQTVCWVNEVNTPRFHWNLWEHKSKLTTNINESYIIRRYSINRCFRLSWKDFSHIWTGLSSQGGVRNERCWFPNRPLRCMFAAIRLTLKYKDVARKVPCKTAVRSGGKGPTYITEQGG